MHLDLDVRVRVGRGARRGARCRRRRRPSPTMTVTSSLSSSTSTSTSAIAASTADSTAAWMPSRVIAIQSPSLIGPHSADAVAHRLRDLAGAHALARRRSSRPDVDVERRVGVVGDQRARAPRPPRRSARPRPARSVRSGTCCATGRCSCCSAARSTPSAGARARTASRICAVDGFIDCPPATTCCTPRPRSRSRRPSPDRRPRRPRWSTARRPAPAAMRRRRRRDPLGSSVDLLEQVGDPDSRGRPDRDAGLDRARRCRRCARGSSRCPSPPTTTIESPRSPHVVLERRRSCVVGVEEVHHLVAERRASSVAAPRVPAATATVLCTTSGSGTGGRSTTCRHASSSSAKPRPPASTTPASASTGSRSGVRGHGVAAPRRRRARARRPSVVSPVAAPRAPTASAAERDDGEDRPLDRAQHRLVRGVGGPAQPGRDVGRPTPRRAARTCRRDPAGSGRGSRPSCPGRP